MASSSSRKIPLVWRLAFLASTTTGCFALFSLDGYGPDTTEADGAPRDAGPASDALFDAVGRLDPNARIVFVTSAEYEGTLGGIEGADAICNAVAADAGLRGTYRAWLSDPTSNPAETFPDLLAPDASPLITPSGVRIAASYADLAANGPRVPIVETENKTALVDAAAPCGEKATTGRAWSNTRVDGRMQEEASSYHCQQWANPERSGVVANVGALDERWSEGCATAEAFQCTRAAHLYCFEQPPQRDE